MRKRFSALAVLLTALLLPVAASAQPASVAPAGCPETYTLKINVWENAAMGLPGVLEVHQRESYSLQFDKDTRVSAYIGEVVRAAALEGKIKWSALPVRFRASLINEESIAEHKFGVVGEQVVAETFVVRGLKVLKFPLADLKKWGAIRLVLLEGDLDSPPIFKATGLKEIRFYNRLPGKKLGEWDNNPVPDCIMNVHAIAGAV